MKRTKEETRMKEADQLGKKGDVRRTAWKGEAFRATPRKQHQSPTKADFLGPAGGFQKTIPGVR
jgi:hypothetical protein